MTWNTVLRNMRENKQRKISSKPALSVSWLISVMLISALLLSGCSGQNGTAADKSAQGTEEAGKISIVTTIFPPYDFVREIARTVGIRTEGYNIREVWGLILDDIIQMDAPLLVFDEADKLTEPVFHYFISLYNKLEEKCGVVFLSTDYIAKRISNGLRYQKPGYKEFYSRIGRKFYELEPTDVNDVFAICSANGVTDRKDIDKVIKEASTCDFDLRRVRKSIHKVKRMTGE